MTFASRSNTQLLLAVLGKLRRQDFDRHGAIEPRVPGAINFAHAPRTQKRADFIEGRVLYLEREAYCPAIITLGILRGAPTALKCLVNAYRQQ